MEAVIITRRRHFILHQAPLITKYIIQHMYRTNTPQKMLRLRASMLNGNGLVHLKLNNVLQRLKLTGFF